MIFGMTVVGPFQANCYVLGCPETREALVIDPGDQPEVIAALLADHKLTPRAYLLTHGHIDHVGAATPLRSKLGGEILLHRADVFLYEHAVLHAIAYGIRLPRTAPADRLLDDGATVSWGRQEGRVLHTPGHSPGGICLLVSGRLLASDEDGENENERPAPDGGRPADNPGTSPDWLFCGDTLFQSSVGRTDLPGGSYESLLKSIEQKILPLPDETVLAPGHGPFSSVGEERRTNPFLRGMR